MAKTKKRKKISSVVELREEEGAAQRAPENGRNQR